MAELAGTNQKAQISDYLAAERTLLAWIRTGLALMGFGFVVARFGLFLRELQVAQHVPSLQSTGFSLWFGVLLITMGVGVNLLAAWRHNRLIKELSLDQEKQSRPSAQVALIAVVLALAGMAVAGYLISVRSTTSSDPPSEGGIMQPAPDTGIRRLPSNHSVDETVERLKGVLQAKGIKLFVLVDHSEEARKAGLDMLPTKLLIFGNPLAGTPVMVASPSIAIDLPLKILVSQDSQGKVWVSYNSAAYLQERHEVPQALVQNIAAVDALAAKAAE